MRSKDAWLLGALGAALSALLAPALLHPGLTLGNYGDIYTFHYPLRHLVASRLQAGQLPFWNPYIFSGTPLLADPQAAVFYPLSALFDLFPLGYAFTLSAAAHLAIAALGMHLLMRSRGLDPAAACSLAAAFAFSPMLVYRIPQGIPTHLAALSYVPWCWLALERGRRGWLAVVWSLQFLSGHPEFAAINALGMILTSLAEPSRLWTVLREGFFALLLCAVQAAPAAELLAESNRPGLPAQFSEAYSMPWSALSALLRPGGAGTPLDGSFPSTPSVFFETRALYAGLLPLFLALCGLRTGPGRRGLFLALIGLALALSPRGLWGFSRVPARFGLLIDWGILTAAAGGWLALKKYSAVSPRLKAAALACVLADLGLWSSRFVYAQDPAVFLAPHPALQELGGRLVRFATDPELANPNKAMLYRAMNVNGYAAYYLRRYAPYVARAAGGPAADPSRTYVRGVDSPQMRRLGAAYVLAPQAGGVELRSRPGAGALMYAEPAGSAASRMPSAEHWISWGSSPQGSRLVLAVPAYPGWRAWIDGIEAPISVHDGLVQAAALPGGAFRARFRFQPTGWPVLCLVSALAWAFWLMPLPGRARP